MAISTKGRISKMKDWIKAYGLYSAIALIAILSIIGIATPVTKQATPQPSYTLKIIELDARTQYLESYIRTLYGTQTSIVNAVNGIRIPSLDNTASKDDISRISAELSALQAELTYVREVYANIVTHCDYELELMDEEIDQIRADLTVHTDNLTIHKEIVE